MGRGKKDNFIIYGATGYTGRLIAEQAVALGLRPTLAGRNAEKVKTLADELGLNWAAFSVDDTAAVLTALKGKAALLSVAGPFSATACQLMDACIKARVHYLDVTGEIDVFELAASKDSAAKKAGITLIPGVGFDIVPSDCLVNHAAVRSKSPISLDLAIQGLQSASRGTAKTMVEGLGRGTAIREGGKIRYIRPGTRQRSFDFGNGAEEFTAVSWGDVSTAYHSTSIGDIAVYFPYRGPIKTVTSLSRHFGFLLKAKFVQKFLKRRIDKMPSGPNETERNTSTATLRAEVTDENGLVFISQLTTPNGYSLTAESAILCCCKLIEGGIEYGFKTPSLAFGSSLINELSGCKLEDH